MSEQKNANVIRALHNLRKAANFEEAALTACGEIAIHREGKDCVTDFVRERTQLYRNTWVNPIIDELIAWAEGRLHGRDIGRIRR